MPLRYFSQDQTCLSSNLIRANSLVVGSLKSVCGKLLILGKSVIRHTHHREGVRSFLEKREPHFAGK